MLVARVYSVLDAVVVEVSCVQGSDENHAHLVIREERRGTPLDPRGALRALADVADLAALLAESDQASSPVHVGESCFP